MEKNLDGAVVAAELFLGSNGGGPEFAGDSVDFLKSIYRNSDLPLPIRQGAAMAVAP